MKKKFQYAMTLAVILAMVFNSLALADTVTPDGDTVTPVNDSTVALGTVAPGDVIERHAGFTLTCTGKQHPDDAQTLSLTYDSGSSTIPAGGSLSATTSTIDIPTAWPDDTSGGGSTNCAPTPQTQTDSGDSIVTITAPSAAGPYSFTVVWNFGLAPNDPDGTGADQSAIVGNTTSVTYTLTVEDTVIDTDADDDGVLDDEDNCPEVANADQADADGDGIGDVCDPDIDNDTVLNGDDNCPFFANVDQADLDGDGIGDACDDDIDSDGVLNSDDNCPSVPNADQLDSDGDGLGNLCDDNAFAPSVATEADDADGDEGDTLTTSGAFADQDGNDTLTIMKVSGVGTVTANSDGTWSWSLPTTDNGFGSVEVQASDGEHAVVSDTFSWSAANVAPSASGGPNGSGIEGSALGFTFACTDPGTADTWNAAVDWGDGSGMESLGAVTCNSGTITPSHTYADDGTYVVTLSVTDDDGDTGTHSANAIVANANPVVAAPAWASTSVSCRKPATLTNISFSDAGLEDNPWHVNIDWGDGSTDTDYNTDTQGAQANQAHTYNAPGTYTALVAVTDKDLGSGSNVSNSLTVNQTYSVKFLQPFDGSSPSNLITNTMKSGRVVPVKVTISDDCAQAYVTDPAALVRINLLASGSTASNDAVEVYADAGASNGNTLYFRWTSDASAPGGGFWIYNLDSKTALNGSAMVINTTYRIDVFVGSVKATATTWALLKPVK